MCTHSCGIVGKKEKRKKKKERQKKRKEGRKEGRKIIESVLSRSPEIL